MMEDIEVRPAAQDDAAYIISTWLNHYKDHSYFAMRIKRSIYFRAQHPIIQNVLMRPGTRAFIAHPVGEPDVIFGFIVIEMRENHPIIHFAFVKEELRGMGIGRKLLAATGIDFYGASFTHWTFTATDLVRRFPHLTYNPYFT